MVTVIYSWYHKSTGRKGRGQIKCKSLQTFRAWLSKWNDLGQREGEKGWEYSEVGLVN